MLSKIDIKPTQHIHFMGSFVHYTQSRGLVKKYLATILEQFSPFSITKHLLCESLVFEALLMSTHTQRMLLWRNERNYPRTITKYSSPTSPRRLGVCILTGWSRVITVCIIELSSSAHPDQIEDKPPPRAPIS